MAERPEKNGVDSTESKDRKRPLKRSPEAVQRKKIPRLEFDASKKQQEKENGGTGEERSDGSNDGSPKVTASVFNRDEADVEKANENQSLVTRAVRSERFHAAVELFARYSYECSLLSYCVTEPLHLLQQLYTRDASVARRQNGSEIDRESLSKAASVAERATFEWFVDVSSSRARQLRQDKTWVVRVLHYAARNKKAGGDIAEHALRALGPVCLSPSQLEAVRLNAENDRNEGVAAALAAYGRALIPRLKADLGGDRCRLLLSAAETRDAAACEWLLSEGLDVRADARELQTLFHRAVRNADHAEAVEIVRLFGPLLPGHLDSLDLNSLTPLHEALNASNFRAADALLELGAKWDVKFKQSVNLLLYCVGKNNLEGARYVHLKDQDQIRACAKTALHIAYQYSNKEMYEWLTAIGKPATS